MNYVTGEVIRSLREKQKLTQKELAERLSVSDKAVSKWETGKGLPDISIIEELARVLKVSLAELLTGEVRTNENRSCNMKQTEFYSCPICGNMIVAAGEGTFSCCGLLLLRQDPEMCDEEHLLNIESVENEFYVTMLHPMEKKHYISYLFYVTSDSVETIKLYPEQELSVRFRKKGHGFLYAFCNRHGLFRKAI